MSTDSSVQSDVNEPESTFYESIGANQPESTSGDSQPIETAAPQQPQEPRNPTEGQAPIPPQRSKYVWIMITMLAALALIAVSVIATLLIVKATPPVTTTITVSEKGIRKDLLVEEALEDISNLMSSHVSMNGVLPKSLSELEDQSYTSQVAVKNNLIEYQPLERTKPEPNNPNYVPQVIDASTAPSYHYKLCANYAEHYDDPLFRYDIKTATWGEKYPSYPNIYHHEAGKTCYDLETYTEFSE